MDSERHQEEPPALTAGGWRDQRWAT